MKITITDATDNTLAANELQGGYSYRDNQGDLFTLVLDENSDRPFAVYFDRGGTPRPPYHCNHLTFPPYHYAGPVTVTLTQPAAD